MIASFSCQLLAIGICLGFLSGAARAEATSKVPKWGLPTANRGLWENKPAQFFMFVDRSTEDGQQLQVWEGGAYGFVRNPRKTATGEVFTKFHEGIDIAPVQRDAAGEPQDAVMAIADGTVAYFTPPSFKSNYGNYIVVKHPCGPSSGAFYSLYAHLAKVGVAVGDTVRRGQSIGIMGHTGAGIDRRRSHLHLELCFLLSERFDEFYATHFKLPNGHGNFNGLNMIGLDIEGFLKASVAKPALTPAEFLSMAEPKWRVITPNPAAGELEIVKRHPFLRKPGASARAWEITFNNAGVPLSVAPSAQAVGTPIVTWVRPSAGFHSWSSRGLLGGSGNTATLSGEGQRYIQLVSGNFTAPKPPEPPAAKLPQGTSPPLPPSKPKLGAPVPARSAKPAPQPTPRPS